MATVWSKGYNGTSKSFESPATVYSQFTMKQRLQ